MTSVEILFFSSGEQYTMTPNAKIGKKLQYWRSIIKPKILSKWKDLLFETVVYLFQDRILGSKELHVLLLPNLFCIFKLFYSSPAAISLLKIKRLSNSCCQMTSGFAWVGYTWFTLACVFIHDIWQQIKERFALK